MKKVHLEEASLHFIRRYHPSNFLKKIEPPNSKEKAEAEAEAE
jgi:hypothetical protein